ncbi:MAG: acyloxyacyl hydrolase, partial [Flavobacteriales bacterium]
HEAYNLPEHGVDVTFINTGNPLQLGQQYSTSYLLNLPLNGKRYVEDCLRLYNKGFRHWIGLGIGLGYTTRPWNLETNHQAAVLGSRVNIALSLQYSARIASFEQSELRAGIRISHLSNGAFQLPNLGTNNAGIFLSYVVGNNQSSYMKVIPAPAFERNAFSIGIVSGLKEIPPPTGRKYAAMVVSALGERRISYKSAFGIGVDAFYDTSLRPLIEQRSDVMPGAKDVMQLGAVFSYGLFFDRFEL